MTKPRHRGVGKRPAVILIDIQTAFTSVRSPRGQNQDRMVDAVRRLLAVTRQFGIPTIYARMAFTEAENESFKRSKKRLPDYRRLLLESSPLTQIDERVKPHRDDFIVRKATPSAFQGTPLRSILRRLETDVLIVTGSSTGSCVRQTTLDARSLGYRVILPAECIDDSFGPIPHETNLYDMGRRFADVMTFEELMDELRGSRVEAPAIARGR